MLQTILTWIAQQVLSYLLGLAAKAVEEKAQQISDDKAKDQTNAKNLDDFRAAVDRQQRIQSALDLLNREHP